MAPLVIENSHIKAIGALGNHSADSTETNDAEGFTHQTHAQENAGLPTFITPPAG